MKKRALYLDTYREIKRSLGRFLSILLIVAVGVGVFTGVKATAPSMYGTAGEYFADNQLMDIEILSTVGFDDGDVDAIKQLDGVAAVMPSYSADINMSIVDGTLITRVMSLPGEGHDAINKPRIREGRMPQAPNECLISNDSPAIGQQVTFTAEDIDGILNEKTYTIVGYADFPQYISYSYGTSAVNGSEIECLAMIPAESFEYSRYTEMYLRLSYLAEGGSEFDDEYEQEIAKLSPQLQALGVDRYQVFLDSSKKELADAEKELEESRKEADEELASAAKELEDAKLQLEEGLAALAQGWIDFEKGDTQARTELKNASAQIVSILNTLYSNEDQVLNGKALYAQAQRDVETQLADAKKQLEAGRQELEAGRKEYNDGLEEYKNGQAQIDDARIAYDDGLAQLEAGRAEYEAALEQYESISALYEQLQDLMESTGDSSQLDSMKEQLEDAKTQLADAKEQIAEGEAQLADAKIQLQDANDQMGSAKEELAAAKAELDAGEAELAAGEAEYETKRQEAYAQLEDALVQIQNGKYQIADAYGQVKEGLLQLADSKMQVAEELGEAQEQLEASEEELEDAQEQYEQGMKEYEEAVKQVEDELSNGMNRIQNAYKDLNELVSGKWYVLDRNDIVSSYSSYVQDANRINAIANVFPIFFLMVAGLVCLTTMSRMVDERRTEMGTYKAMGYSQSDIISKYLVYAALAGLLGSVFGTVVGVQVLPRSIFSAYSMLYYLPFFNIKMPWAVIAISFVVAMLCTVLVAYVSCTKELKVTTAALMRPKAPKAGKRIWIERIPSLWKMLSFSQKLTMRNLFRYKVRLMMTVIGIAGSMALIVAGFGLNDAITPLVEKQYGELSKYDMTIALVDNYNNKEIVEVSESIMEHEAVTGLLPLKSVSGVKAYAPGAEDALGDTYLIVPKDMESLADYMVLRDPDSKSQVTLDKNGVIITEKMAEKLGVGIGGKVEVAVEETHYTMEVSGITENYIYNYVYIAPEYYQKVFKAAPSYNTIYAKYDTSVDSDLLYDEIVSANDSILYMYTTTDTSEMAAETFDSLKMVVYIIILCAGLLAFIVLYNLTNINISERVREIATIKVLGFKKGEVNMYIFRENIFMSIFGIIVGTILGYFMAYYIIGAVEVDMVRFVREIKPISYVYSAVLTMIFTVLVNFVMTVKIKAISMVESLKAIE